MGNDMLKPRIIFDATGSFRQSLLSLFLGDSSAIAQSAEQATDVEVEFR